MNNLKEFISRAFLVGDIQNTKHIIDLYESGNHPWQRSNSMDAFYYKSEKEQRNRDNLERARYDIDEFKFRQKIRILGVGLVGLAPVATAIALQLLAH